MDGVKPGLEVHLLDAMQDGLAQMAQILAGRSGISAIHLISHGSEAVLQLGTLNLNAQNLQAHAGDLATIGTALNPNADILLYGCNVAKGSDGAAFVQAIAKDTHSVIAASTDLTGAAGKGGNWVFEKKTGQIDAKKALSDRALLDYDWLLKLPEDGAYTFTDATLDSPIPWSITTSDGFFVLSSYDAVTGIAGATQADGFGAFISNTSVDTAADSYIEIKTTTTGSFQLTSATIGEIMYSPIADGCKFSNVYVVGYANGVPVCQTAPYDSTLSYETAYNINYTPFSGKTIDTLRVYYSTANDSSTTQSVFNVVGISIKGASNTPAPTAAPTISAMAYMIGSGAHFIDKAHTANIGSSDFTSKTLTVSINNATASDLLSIHNQGTGTNQIGVSNGNVSFSNNPIGTFNFTFAGNTATLTVTFASSNVTKAALEALLRNITYANSNLASVASRTVSFTGTNVSGTYTPSTVTITLTRPGFHQLWG